MATVSTKQKPKRRRNGAGYSVPAAADELGVPYKSLRKAIKRGQAHTIEWGGIERLTRKEVERLKGEFGQT